MLNELDVTRFPGGLSTRPLNDIFSSLGMPDPTRFHTFFDDFDTYTAGQWTVTETQAGATQALTDGDGGLLLLTNSAADDDQILLQKVGESFRFAAGKRLFFKARLAVSDATQSDFILGLVITDTTPYDTTDGVFFQKDDGAATVSFHAEKNNVQVSAAAAATVVAATQTEFGFYYDGIDRIWYMVNGTVLGYITPSTSLPDDEDLTITIGLRNGEAAAKTMSVDYVFCAKER